MHEKGAKVGQISKSRPLDQESPTITTNPDFQIHKSLLINGVVCQTKSGLDV